MALESCYATAITHTIPKACFTLWGAITRVFFIKPNAAAPFSGIDVAALKTDIETEASWTTAIAALDPDNIIGTPEVTGYDFPQVNIKTITTPYGATIPVDKEDLVLTIEMIGLSEAEQTALNTVNFQALDFAFYSDTHSQLIGQASTLNTTMPFFSAYSVVLKNREGNSGGEDKNVLEIYCKGDAYDDWAAFDCSFLASK